ncbi:CDP-alcohol phosphatidyltransferase-like enzyme [Novosphingobium sp. PhB165]|uniref:CDP-alcohol phosphatidyltransferase family protein n=1 Tax=Novosphingobium sp. PhB165 TaxID=2485105 RepID=UPI00104E537F|nr:CDP-alcohol phosphatidyltransferase family protein [Novosphingobium sp. PhB165]TCM15737.1 CDP-alcohol phosphatidyltransferase-like enzyme [Novosphingobium sp. PhB165]
MASRDEKIETKAIQRIQQNLLARSERKVLNWLCARMPDWVMPDLLTGIGMIGALMVFSGYVASNLGDGWLWLSISGYFVQWFGDSMDGSLARFRHIERPRYGYFLDHSCDGLATTLVVVGIGLSGYVLLEVALIALAGYLLLSIHAFLAVRVLGEMKLSYAYAGPTELRILLIGLTLAMILAGSQPVFFGLFTWFDLLVGSIGLLLIVFFIIQTLRTARRLAQDEPPIRNWR